MVNPTAEAAEDPAQCSPARAYTASEAARSRALAEVVVKDNGREIADADLQQIRNPFYTTRLTEGGAGLGLSVAHGIITAPSRSVVRSVRERESRCG